MFNKKKNIEKLISQYNYLKSIESDDIKKMNEINEVKKAFEYATNEVICKVSLNGSLDYIKRCFDNDFNECQYNLNSTIKRTKFLIENINERENLQYLIISKLELKLKMSTSKINDINSIIIKLDNINKTIELIGSTLSDDIQLKIKNEIETMNDLIDRMVSDKYASNEAQDYIDTECAIIKRNSDRKRIEEKLKKYNIISDTVDNTNSQKL